MEPRPAQHGIFDEVLLCPLMQHGCSYLLCSFLRLSTVCPPRIWSTQTLLLSAVLSAITPCEFYQIKTAIHYVRVHLHSERAPSDLAVQTLQSQEPRHEHTQGSLDHPMT